MMTGQQRKKLETVLHGMVYREYTVNGVHHHVTDFEMTDLKVIIKTDTKEFNILYANIERMLDMFIEVEGSGQTIDITPDDIAPDAFIQEATAHEYIQEETEAPEPGKSVEYIEKPQIQALSASGEVKNILMDNIRKLQRDKSYIHQAAAINESVKTLIEFAKTEIQGQELILKMNQGLKQPKTKLLA